MFEELILAVIAIIVVVVIAAYSFFFGAQSLDDLLLKASSARDRLAIAERKFMQGKIKRGVFDSLSSQLEEELVSYELALFRLQKSPFVVVAPKAKKLLAAMERPNNYRRSKISAILKETELIRHEMSLLEAKLLKRVIRESVFEKLIAQREAKLIEKEKALVDIVVSSGGSLESAK